MKIKKVLLTFFVFFIFCTISLDAMEKNTHNQESWTAKEQILSKKIGNKALDYASPSFNNPNYYYAAIKSSPINVFYRQAGLSPDGTKILAGKQYVDGLITRREVVLMNADGTNENVISPGNSGEGDIYQYGNPFWSDDGTSIGYVEVHNANSNKVIKYALLTMTSTYIYEPVAPQDVNNADFLGGSTTSIVFWDRDGGGYADLFTWDGTTLTDITNTPSIKEYEPCSNGDGTKILYWSGETVDEPINTTHTLNYSGGLWTKDVGFAPIADSYWGYFSNRADNYIAVTIASSSDVLLYSNSGTFVMDLTGPAYSGGAGQWNFLGSGFEGPHGEILMTSNAGRGATPGRDIVLAFRSPALLSPVNYAVGQSILPTFTWSGVSGAIFNFEIFNNGSFAGSPIASYSGTSTSYSFLYTSTASPILNNGNVYYWRVKQTVATETSGWSQREFVTVNSAVPILSKTNLSATSVNILWYPSQYSSGLIYDLICSANSNMSNPISLPSSTELTNNYYHIQDLNSGTPYYVQVRSKNSSGVIISYSSVLSFTTIGLPAPALSWPVGSPAPIVYANPPTLSWYLNNYDASYTYRVKYWTGDAGNEPGGLTAQTGISGCFDTGSNITSTTLTAALTPGATYTWEVAVKSSNGTVGTFSSSADFIINNDAQLTAVVPTASWPVNNATVYFNPPTLSWYLGTFATGLYFYVEVSTSPIRGGDGSFTGGVVYHSAGWTSNNLYETITTPLTPGLPYYWHVRSSLYQNGASPSDYSSNGSFTIALTASGAAGLPILSYPTGNVIVDAPLSEVELSWTAYSSYTLDYQVRMATNESVNGEGMLIHGSAIQTGWISTTAILANNIGAMSLTPGATYYWQVRSSLHSDNNVVSPWSLVGKFSTAAGSSSVVPLVISPNYGQPINNSSAVLTWNIPVQTQSHLKYDLQYSKNADFSAATIKSNLDEPVIQVNGLDQNSTYYWRVLSKTDNGSISSYSTTGSFTTSGTTAVEEQETIPTAYELSQNYPNPFNPTTRINFAIPQNSFVTIKVYDMLGREVKTLINQQMVSGNHSIDWNADNNLGIKVSTGMYIYRITAGNFVSTKKMVLIK